MVDAPTERARPVAARSSGGYGGKRALALAVMSFCVLIPMMDLTMVSVALPAIHQDLRAGTVQLQWIMGGYLLATASVMLIVPAVGDRLGHRRTLLAGLTLFGVASAAGFLAPDTAVLVGTRVLMGTGAAVVLPMTMAILFRVFRDHELQRATSVAGAVVSFANPIGPVIAGILIDRLSWDWIFLVNVIMVVIVVPLTPWLLPESRSPQPSRLDVPSVLLVTASATACMYGVISAGNGWARGPALAWLAGGLVMLAGFGLRQRRAAVPLIPPAALRTPRYLWAQGMLVVGSFAWYGALFLVPVYLIDVLGRSALEVGIRLLPCGASGLVATRIGERLAQRFDARWIVGTGLTVLAVALFVMSLATPHGGANLVTIALAFVSLGGGIPQASAMMAAMRTLPAGYQGAGAGFINAFRQLGGGFGIAVIGSVAAAVYQRALPPAAPHAVRASITAAGPHARYAAVAFAHGMSVAFVCAAVIALAVAALACLTPQGPRGPQGAPA